MMTNNESDIIGSKSDEEGAMAVTVHQIFSGIQVLFIEAHIRSYIYHKEDESDDMYEIIHCKEGQLEYLDSGELCYIAAGDLAILKRKRSSNTIHFPTNHFEGIFIRMETERILEELSILMEEKDAVSVRVLEKFCDEKMGYVIHSNDFVEHIFAELYSVPEKIKKDYLKLKILELLLFLDDFERKDKQQEMPVCSKIQETLAQEVEEYFLQRMDKHITLEQLSEHFHVSVTHIKNTFKMVYGESYYSYVRMKKMESAAYLLEHTEKTVLEIAGIHGYENGSKFSSAFKQMKGISPVKYRKLKRKK